MSTLVVTNTSTNLLGMTASDSIYCEAVCSAEDVYYSGSDDENYESPEQRRKRYEAAGQRYLEGSLPFILSASLRGPFDQKSGWKNPWASSKRCTTKLGKRFSRTSCSAERPCKYQRIRESEKGRRLTSTDKETYLPSPESLKQAPLTEQHPYLEDEALERVQNWQSNLEHATYPVSSRPSSSLHSLFHLNTEPKPPNKAWLRTETSRKNNKHPRHSAQSALGAIVAEPNQRFNGLRSPLSRSSVSSSDYLSELGGSKESLSQSGRLSKTTFELGIYGGIRNEILNPSKAPEPTSTSQTLYSQQISNVFEQQHFLAHGNYGQKSSETLKLSSSLLLGAKQRSSPKSLETGPESTSGSNGPFPISLDMVNEAGSCRASTHSTDSVGTEAVEVDGEDQEKNVEVDTAVTQHNEVVDGREHPSVECEVRRELAHVAKNASSEAIDTVEKTVHVPALEDDLALSVDSAQEQLEPSENSELSTVEEVLELEKLDNEQLSNGKDTKPTQESEVGSGEAFHSVVSNSDATFAHREVSRPDCNHNLTPTVTQEDVSGFPAVEPGQISEVFYTDQRKKSFNHSMPLNSVEGSIPEELLETNEKGIETSPGVEECLMTIEGGILDTSSREDQEYNSEPKGDNLCLSSQDEASYQLIEEYEGHIFPESQNPLHLVDAQYSKVETTAEAAFSVALEADPQSPPGLTPLESDHTNARQTTPCDGHTHIVNCESQDAETRTSSTFSAQRMVTPEPTFCVTSFAAFLSPSPDKRKTSTRSSSGRKLFGILSSNTGRGSSRVPGKKNVTWAALSSNGVEEALNDTTVNSTRRIREHSPPPMTTLSDLPMGDNEKFSRHFSAVIGRTDGLQHKFRSQPWQAAQYSVDEANAGFDEMSAPHAEDTNMTDACEPSIGEVRDSLRRERITLSEDPMDVLDEMGDILQAWDLDAELSNASRTKQSVAIPVAMS